MKIATLKKKINEITKNNFLNKKKLLLFTFFIQFFSYSIEKKKKNNFLN
jgi:hypothetical protein